MSIIIRLQNLPWAADSMDIRRFFSGLSIPEGGVHIVGGEMGDVFIAFSSDEDARLAMAKDGGKIHEMQVKLLLSSRTEMLKVIDRARQQNIALQSQGMVPVPVTSAGVQLPSSGLRQSDSKRNRSPSPDHRRRGGRDRSPAPRHHSPPDARRSGARGRSRSPPGRSRGSGRDMDRRSDRGKKERYDSDSRYSRSGDDRRSSRDGRDTSRENSREATKYTDTTSAVPGRASQGDRDGQYSTPPQYNSGSNSTTGYSSQTATSKDLPAAFQNPPSSDPPKPPLNFSDASVLDKIKLSLSQIANSSASSSSQQQASYSSMSPFDLLKPAGLTQSLFPIVQDNGTGNNQEQQQQSKVRRSRFEPEIPAPQLPGSPFFGSGSNSNVQITNTLPNVATSYGKDFIAPRVDFFPKDSNSQPWRQGELPPESQDYAKPIDMDLDPPEVTPFPDVQRSPRVANMPLRDEDSRVRPLNNQAQGPPQDQQPSNRWTPALPPAPFPAVDIRGLPPDVRVQDILQELFPHLPAANVCLVNNNQGVEKALVKLFNKSELHSLLGGMPRYIRNHRLVITEIPSEVFDAMVTVQQTFRIKPKPKPREEDLCVNLRGLPFHCKEDDLIRFFEGLHMVDMFISMTPEGRCQGSAFVVLASQQDFRSALTFNGKMIAHRYITISVASKEMMAVAKGDNVPLKHPRGRCFLSLNNLPESATDRVIANIFTGLDVAVTAIHILLNEDKTPSGQAFVEVASQRDGDVAVSANGKPMFGRRLSIRQVSFEEMNNVIDPPPLPPPPMPGALLRTPAADGPEGSRRPLLSKAPESPYRDSDIRQSMERPPMDRGPMDRPHMDRLPMDRPPMERGPVDRPHMDRPPMERGPVDRPHMDRPPLERGPMDRPPLDRLPMERGSMDRPPLDRPMDRPPREDLMRDRPPMDRPPRDDLMRDRSLHDDMSMMDRPPRDYMDRPPFEGDRPPRDDRAPYMDRPPHDRPYIDRGPRDHFMDRLPRGDRPFSDRPPRGDRPYMDRPPRGDPFMDRLPRGDRPFMDRGGERGPRIEFGRGGRGPRPPFPRPPFRPPLEDVVADFGAPGCVVSINNLHWSAGLEELLDFFTGFRLTKDNIIRKFNERKQVTGEARVAFESSSEAQRAVRELNRKPIMGRNLTLELL